MSPLIIKWVIFNLFVVAMLALDLGVFHRKAHEVKMKEALLWSGFWILLSLLFNVFVYFWKGPGPALEFLTGYLIEKSLSVDNIFVFVMLFSYFRVPPQYQHRVLFWGILGALVLRGILIAVGAVLIANFEWVIYVFGAFLIYTGFKMAVQKEHGVDPSHNPVVNWFRKFVPITKYYCGQRLVVGKMGKIVATPLMLVLVTVEFTDLVFALDSIPAIFAVTRDPFIVYTSNVFAILGLRALYFALAGVVHKFGYLKLGLGVVLTFVGVKMLLSHTRFEIATAWALVVVGIIITLSIVASLLWPKKTPPPETPGI
ncbi:TerC family protein [bacterium]|nr:TerC family protein [bacterium]MBU1984821.1 TerC family protein [bacterium]